MGLRQNVRAPWASGAYTKLLLAAVPMQVDPQLPPDVILHAWVLLIMQTVQGAAHHCVHLRPRTRGRKTTSSDARGKPRGGGEAQLPHTAYAQWVTCHSAKQETLSPGGRSCPEDGESQTLKQSLAVSKVTGQLCSPFSRLPYFGFFFFLATLLSLWDLSFSTRD